MKRGVALSSVIAVSLCATSLFIIPVNADPYDYNYQIIDINNYNAYLYWQGRGFTLTDAVETDQETGVVYSGDLQGCLSVPYIYDSYIQNSGIAITWEGEQRPYTITLGDCSGQATNISLSSSINNRIEYVRPQLMNSSYTPVTSYYSPTAVRIPKDDTFHLAFMTRGSISSSDIHIYTSTGNSNYTLKRNLVNVVSTYTTYDITVTAGETAYYNIELPASIKNYPITPLLADLESTLTDDQRKLVGLETDLASQLQDLFNQQNQLLEQGNNTSQSAGTALEGQTQQLTSTNNQLVNYEDTFTQSLNLSMENIDPSTDDLVGTSGFTNSVSWIIARFNDLLSVTAISNVFIFVLVLGIAGLLIGKV